MRQYISPVAFVVRDYEEAIEFFVGKLNFELVEDTSVEARRWVLVRPPGAASPTCLLLA
jgi:catechol 2,3-dioxygenase-like lactoylglutathione lyase family enzyme